MNEKYVLYGTIQRFSQYNGRVYGEEIFQKALEDYNRKLIYERRKRIVDKLLKEAWTK